MNWLVALDDHRKFFAGSKAGTKLLTARDLVNHLSTQDQGYAGHVATIVSDCYSDDGSLRVNDGPATVGRQEITQLAQSFMSTLADLCVVMDKLRALDEPEYHWTLLGSNSGFRQYGP